METFYRCKKHFPKFHDFESAKIFIGHYIAEYNQGKLSILDMFIILRLKAILQKLERQSYRSTEL
jgi:hypothetical protein